MYTPLNTRRIWLEKLDIQLSDDFADSKSEEYKIDLKIDVRQKADALDFRIALGLVLRPSGDASCRYDRIAISMIGVFDLPSDTPAEMVHQLVPYNCLAILHGFARGVVAQVTGLNDGGPFLLPTVNFVEALQKKSRTKKVSVSQ